MRIVITGRIPQVALDPLAALGDVWMSPFDRPLTAKELLGVVRGADAVVTMLHDRVGESFFEAAGPRLRCVANVAVGYDNIDVPAATRRGVTVTNTPDVLTDATADFAIALMLALTRRLPEGERLVRARRPWQWGLSFMLGSELRDKTLGVIGLGAIGTATAVRAKAFGMRIVYSGRSAAARETESILEAERLPVDDLLKRSDVVSIHCPLAPDTKHLICHERLRLMKPTSYLVNTARGPIVDEAALSAALRERIIAGAALDVYEDEPEVHPGLLDLDNVVLAPHMGSATSETRTAMAEMAARSVIAVLTTGRAGTAVN